MYPNTHTGIDPTLDFHPPDVIPGQQVQPTIDQPTTDQPTIYPPPFAGPLTSDLANRPSAPVRQLARLAAKLHRSLGGQDRRFTEIDLAFGRVERQFASVRRRRRRYEILRRRPTEPATRLREQLLHDLLHELDGLRYAAADAYTMLQATPAVCPVSPGRIFDDLRALESNEGFTFDRRTVTLSVLTEPVVLESLALGRFRLNLACKRLLDGRADGGAFSVEALTPNPPDGDASITHPHVRDGIPCLGDATVPIQTALRQGRLADAFELLERVLHTYNEVVSLSLDRRVAWRAV